MVKSRSEKLQPEYVLATGERLKRMAAVGWAIGQITSKELDEINRLKFPARKLDRYVGPQGLELMDSIDEMNEEEKLSR